MNKAKNLAHQQQLSTWTIELIHAGQEVWLEANGYSMFPVLKPGDKIKVVPFPIDGITPGDLIVFQRKQYFVLHRVVEKSSDDKKTTLKTKGDSEFNFDEDVDNTNYIGKITKYKRGEREFEMAASGPPNTIKTVYNWFRKKVKIRYNWF